ncbi:hypothetical protein [Actinosynnema sp. NPDC020468]|uniref:hypothetical protein n=1 Tax=Actinosynnema sp. NPDC020468 TaxID=3154488 RepID=UPI0033E3D047
MAEQATVSIHHPDGSATVLRDDGVLLDATADAVAAGGWRTLRAGQRVTVVRNPSGAVEALVRPV